MTLLHLVLGGSLSSSFSLAPSTTTLRWGARRAQLIQGGHVEQIDASQPREVQRAYSGGHGSPLPTARADQIVRIFSSVWKHLNSGPTVDSALLLSCPSAPYPPPVPIDQSTTSRRLRREDARKHDTGVQSIPTPISTKQSSTHTNTHTRADGETRTEREEAHTATRGSIIGKKVLLQSYRSVSWNVCNVNPTPEELARLLGVTVEKQITEKHSARRDRLIDDV